jgi:subtilase family serine protease
MAKPIFVSGILILISTIIAFPVLADYHFSNFKGRPPIHIYGSSSKKPLGLSPEQVKAAYNLPATGGHGTIVIIGAYDDKTIEDDLNVFSQTFNLPECTIANGCFEKHKMSDSVKPSSGWSMETSLDVEWAHAIAPKAKILLVEATTPSGKNLLDAIDYAAGRTDAAAVSMSWGGGEFPEEATMDSHFISKSGAVFFASSGDDGTGVSWPAASANVVAVGGTSLKLDAKNKVVSETAWAGSGGGISVYEKQPAYQSGYGIAKAGGMRAIPDVSLNADPQNGFAIYKSSSGGKGIWYRVGGTSASAPQWAAIRSLGLSASNEKFYSDKASENYSTYFRDIVSGKNGDCGYLCMARKRYDYVTGLGSPLTVNF